MKKLYIYFTKATEVYANVYSKKLFKIDVSDPRSPKHSGFCSLNKKWAIIEFIDSKPNLSFDLKSKHTNNTTILLIHDSLELSNSPVVVQFIEKSLIDFDSIFVFHHNRNKNNYQVFGEITSSYKDKVFSKPRFNSIENIGFSHGAGDFENPFYRLSEIWGCKNQNDYERKLFEFEGFLKSNSNVSLEIELKDKLEFLHKLLGKQFDDERFKTLLNSFKDEYNIEYNEQDHLESVRVIRDKILEAI